MVNETIISYIKLEREKGTSDAQIETSLVANGWTREDVLQAREELVKRGTQENYVSSQEAEKLKKFQNEARIILNVLGVLFVVVLFVFFGQQVFGGTSPVPFIITGLIISFCAAHLASKNLKKLKEGSLGQALAFIFCLLAFIFWFWFLAIGAFFAFCLFSIGGYM